MELTSTRFFAAMAVLLGHFSDLLALPPVVSQLISGGIGVSFFFVLSGFILTYRYWDSFSVSVNAQSFRRYFVARIARVYPLYVVALLLMTGLYLAMVAVRPGAIGFPPNPVISWLTNLLALQTFAPTRETQQFWNAPAWSISTEFAFYLMLPFMLAGLSRVAKGMHGLVMLLLLVMGLGALAQATTLLLVMGFGWDRVFWLDTVASRNIFWRLPEFMAGVVTARLLFGGHLAWLQAASARNLLLIGSLLTVLLINMAPWPQDNNSFMVLRQFRLELGYALPFAALVAALAAGPTFVSTVLGRPYAINLGEASYALYIFHWIPWTGLTVLKAHGLPIPPALVAAVIGLTILCSLASYLWFEKPVRSYVRLKFGH
jgi:peptidoglycan/LPS O-acetylase OafA/YrhL